MINRQGLIIVNNSKKCSGGPITRRRTVNGKIEESCIDFILVSHELGNQLNSATNESGFKLFQEMTTSSTKLRKCFQIQNPIGFDKCVET